jgi:hypothetical protein
MITYPSIATLFVRNAQTNKVTQLVLPELQPLLAEDTLLITEKVDGEGGRFVVKELGEAVIPYSITFGNRTKMIDETTPKDNPLTWHAEQYAKYYPKLMGIQSRFKDQLPLIIFYELYGHKIQAKGKDYLPDSRDIVVFDCYSEKWDKWWDFDELSLLKLPVVPMVDGGDLPSAYVTLKRYLLFETSRLNADTSMEGYVIRPLKETKLSNGERMFAKIKKGDFKE